MVAKLSSLLVQEGVVTARRVEEALQRQVIYGGSLGTNLLEMNAISEGELTRSLAAATGLEPADGRWLKEASADAQGQFPRKQVERHHILPVGITSEGVVRVVVSEDVAEGVLEALEEELEIKLDAYVAPEYRFQYGLERHYQIPMRSRYARLMRELSRRQSAAGASAAPQRYGVAIDRLDAGWGAGDDKAGAREATAEGKRADEDIKTAPERKALVDESDKPAPARATTPRPEARRRAAQPEPKPAPAAKPVERSASPPPANEIEEIPADKTVVSSPPKHEHREQVSVKVRAGDKRTSTPPPRRAMALRKAAEALDAAGSRQDVLDASLGYLKSRLTHAWAFTLGKGKARLRAWDAPGSSPPEDLEVDLGDSSILKTLASAGGPYVGPVPSDMGTLKLMKTLDDDPAAGIIALPVMMRGRPVIAFVGHADGFAPPPHLVAEFASFSELVAAALANVILLQKGLGERTMSLLDQVGGGDPVISGVKPARTMPAPAPARAATPAKVSKPVSPDDSDKPAAKKAAPPPRSESPAGQAKSAPAAPAVEPKPSDARNTNPVAEAPRGRTKSPVTQPTSKSQIEALPPDDDEPASSQERSETARTGEKRRLTPEEKTAIEGAVRRLCEADTEDRDDALEALLEFGEDALPDLMSEFPGPIDLERQGLEPGNFPDPERFGPVIAALRKLGEAAVEHLREHLSDHRPRHRFHAVQLLGARIDSGLMEDLAAALYDEDVTVRAAAADALSPLKNEPGYATVRERLFDELNGGGPRASNAADGLVAMREPQAVDKLIERLTSNVQSVRIHAHRALRTLTRFDKGPEPRKWRSWWRKYGSRKRVEWLIDALLEPDRELRSAAAEELHHLTGQRIPFNPDGVKREWKRARKAWLAWYKA